MNRKSFIKNTIMGLGAVSASSIVNEKDEKESTFDKLSKQVGFNHIPNKEIKTMQSVLHKANTRGRADHGWLVSHHTFSFANYYNPERMNFGVLRVLNDDYVASGKGFSKHPHDNMEIISIPLKGDLEHKDSMGNVAVIKEGDIQVMSAGTGIYHSEYNKNQDKEVRFLQIWLFPNKKNVTPRYDQIKINSSKTKNRFNQILSPSEKDEGVWIHQNAWFDLGELDQDIVISHKLRDPHNGLYIFVIDGQLDVEGQQLDKRDGYGMWNVDEVKITSKEKSHVLLMEVPMTM